MTEVDQSAQIGVEACILFKLYGNKYWFIVDISVDQNHFSIKVAKLLYSLKPILINGGIVVCCNCRGTFSFASGILRNLTHDFFFLICFLWVTCGGTRDLLGLLFMFFESEWGCCSFTF